MISSAISSSSSNDLTLDADNDIIASANITRSGSGGLVQQALDQYLVRVPLVWEADPQLALQVELP